MLLSSVQWSMLLQKQIPLILAAEQAINHATKDGFCLASLCTSCGSWLCCAYPQSEEMIRPSHPQAMAHAQHAVLTVQACM